MKVVIREKAAEELEAIFAWIANDNPSAALRVVQRIRHRIGRLATTGMAHMGRPGVIEGNTICSDMPTPEAVLGLTYMRYCTNTEPPTAVIAALITVTRSFSRMTLMPIAAAAVPSSPIASSAALRMPRSVQSRIASTN